MNLAAFYHERSREAGAEDLYVRAGAIFERMFGPAAPLTLVVRNELADVLRAQRRFSESERLGNASLTAMEKAFSAADPRLLRALGNRARLLAETRRQMVDRNRLFGTPAYKWIPARGKLEAEYWIVSNIADVIPESLAWPEP